MIIAPAKLRRVPLGPPRRDPKLSQIVGTPHSWDPQPKHETGLDVGCSYILSEATGYRICGLPRSGNSPYCREHAGLTGQSEGLEPARE